MHSDEKENFLMQVRYNLITQLYDSTLTNMNKATFPTKKLRSETILNISPFIEREQSNATLSKSVKSSVGGVLGIGSSEGITKFTIEKDQFKVGETMKVHIDANLTNCSKDIVKFKYRLKRIIRFKCSDFQRTIKTTIQYSKVD